MPAVDLVSHVKQLTKRPGTALSGAPGWGFHEENTARLFESLAYQLELNWLDRTTDPNDPEVRRERAKRLKPPPHPIIPPIAFRPEDLAKARFAEYSEAIRLYQAGGSPQLVSSDEFDRQLDL